MSQNDILNELNNKSFNESKANKLLKEIDVNQKFNDGENFLHKVIPQNNIEAIKALITHDININQTNLDGDSALIIAARYPFVDTIDVLIEAGADIKLTNDKARIAIQEAIRTNNIMGYKALCKHQKEFNHIDNDGNTLIHDAIIANNQEILNDLLRNKKLLPAYSVIFCKELYMDAVLLKTVLQYFEDINITDDEGQNLLFYLVHDGYESYESLIHVLKKGVDINCVNSHGENVLIYLVKQIIAYSQNSEIDPQEEKNLIELIPALIEEGIDLTHCDNDGENALSLATKALHIDTVQALLEYDCDPNVVNSANENSLSIACMMGNKALDLIYLLLDFGASPNIADKDGKTLIEKLIDIELFKKSGKRLKASERRYIDEKHDYLMILDGVLTNAEAQLNKLNSKGEPYIFEAITYGNIGLIKLMVKHGADLNQIDENGLNIIYKTIGENKTFRREIDQKNFYTNLKAIIGLGANVNAKDSYGGITLHKAILDNDIQTVKIIMHGGANINAIDNRGRNMVHNTVWKSKINTFKLIHSFNKKLLNEPDKFGVLPINYAAFLGYTDMVLDLLEHGSHLNNPHRKTKYILNFLKRFHKNLRPLEEKAISKAEKQKIQTLVENMIKEFEVV